MEHLGGHHVTMASPRLIAGRNKCMRPLLRAGVAWLALAVLNSPGASAAPSDAIPASLFGMSSVNSADFPNVPIGSLGKQGPWGWAVVQPNGPDDWSGLATVDAYAQAATDNGVDYFFDLGGSPSWAARDGKKGCHGGGFCPSPPKNWDNWRTYITRLVSHEKDRGTAIAYYEVWNEPNYQYWWTGTYADMVQAAQIAYTTIKGLDPAAQILTPAPTGPLSLKASSCNPDQEISEPEVNAQDWMSCYLSAGGAQYADVGAFHGYIGLPGATMSNTGLYPWPEQNTAAKQCLPRVCYGSINDKVQAMRAAFDNNGMAGKPMFDTEGSWGVPTPDPSNLPAQNQPAWLGRWFLLQASQYAPGAAGRNLERAYWWNWGGPAGGKLWGDVENYDGSHTPNAAGVAYEQVYSWLVGATFTEPCSPASDGVTWSCGLTLASGANSRVVWSADPSGQAVTTYATTGEQELDLYGGTTVICVSGPVEVGADPVLFIRPKTSPPILPPCDCKPYTCD